MRELRSSQPSLVRLQLDGSECPCDLLENRESVAFWNYPNCTEPTKVLGIIFAEDSPQNQNRRAGTSQSKISENRSGIEFRRMVSNKYQVERRGLDQLAGFHFVPCDSGIKVCLFECVLQRDKGVWVCVEKKYSVTLFHGVAPEELFKVCVREHRSA
jgi:hypothetical protein